MGLFSKKTYVCERCGKEYEARINFGSNVCKECLKRESQKKEYVIGYVDYASEMGKPEYTEQQLDKIANHRDSVLEKYRPQSDFPPEKLRRIIDSPKNATSEEATIAAKSLVVTLIGAGISPYFFAPTTYEKTIVDAKDVFAVGFTSDHKLKVNNGEAILCAVFTNDPYIPVFPVVYFGKFGLFEGFKSKKGRASVVSIFEKSCPNLTYPVQELKTLKKQIKSEDTVKGDLDKKFMLDKISDASCSSGIFNTTKIRQELSYSTSEMLQSYGYIVTK